MAAPWAIYAGIKAGGAALGYLTRKKRRPFAQTEYGKHLKEISEQGIYTPEMQRTMLGRVGTAAGSEAQKRKAAIRGRAEASGVGARSVAVQGLLDRPGQQAQRQVATAAQDISEQQEMSKVQAKAKYKEMMYGTEQQRISEEQAARSRLWGGLIEAGAAGYGAYTQEKQFGKRMEGEKDRIEMMRPYYEGMADTRKLSEQHRYEEFMAGLPIAKLKAETAHMQQQRLLNEAGIKIADTKIKEFSKPYTKNYNERLEENLLEIGKDQSELSADEKFAIDQKSNFEALIMTGRDITATNEVWVRNIGMAIKSFYTGREDEFRKVMDYVENLPTKEEQVRQLRMALQWLINERR